MYQAYHITAYMLDDDKPHRLDRTTDDVDEARETAREYRDRGYSVHVMKGVYIDVDDFLESSE